MIRMGCFLLKLHPWIKLICFISVSVSIFGSQIEQSFTPSDIQFRVERIDLSSEMAFGQPSGDIMNLYSCTDGDCLLSLSDNQWLQRLKQFRQIKASAYRYLTVTSCSGNATNFQSKLKGVVNIDGHNYITHPIEGLRQRVGSEPEEYVSVTFTRCRFYHELQEDMVVKDSEEIILDLMVDLNMIAWGRLGIKIMESGCFQSDATLSSPSYSVCMGIPHMIPIVGGVSPTIDRYNIHKGGTLESTAGSQMVLFISPENSILGGFTRRLFSNSSQPNDVGEFDMSLKRVRMNANGTYEMETFGHLFDSFYLTFPEFNLGDHQNVYQGKSGLSYDYQATKL